MSAFPYFTSGRSPFLALALSIAACGGGDDAPPSDARAGAPWPVAFELPDEVQPRYERVVLVTLDTLRADHLSSYGYARQTSPFLDGLARKGVLFTRAVASSSHTAPSHASMLTGLPPAAHGVLKNGNALDAGAADLGRLFARAGFETAAFPNVRFLTEICGSFDTVEVGPDRGEAAVTAAIRWLEDGRDSQRFLLWVHLFDPHYWKDDALTPESELATIRAADQRDPDERQAYLRELHALPAPAPGEAIADMDDDRDDGPRKRGRFARAADLGSLSQEDFLERIDAYDAQILYADRQLERIFEALEGLELPGTTLWIVTADHGEGLGSHGIAGHGGRIYQEQLRIPLVVYATDDSLEPQRSDALVQHVDLLPTLAQTLGARLTGLDPASDGASLWPLMNGDAADWRERPAFAQRPPKGQVELYSLQTRRWKYILHEPGKDELYDLERDSLELENLAEIESSERDELLRLVRERLERERARAPGQPTPELSPEILEELRALGYLR